MGFTASFLILVRPLSWGAALGSCVGCWIGIAASRMQAILNNVREAPKQSSLDVNVAPRPLMAGETCEADGVIADAHMDFKLLGSMPHELQEREFVRLLRNLVAESRHLYHDPMSHTVPEERRAATLVRDELECFSQPGFGPLVIREFEYDPHRTNLMVMYDWRMYDSNSCDIPAVASAEGQSEKVIAFVGAHFDIMPFERPLGHAAENDGCVPLKSFFGLDCHGDTDTSLVEESDADTLKGRGTSSCLGHVALLTLFLSELARSRPKLDHKILVIFLAAREGGEANIGADRLLEDLEKINAENINAGRLGDRALSEDLKKGRGSVFWLDVGDSMLCHATTGFLGWTLTATAGQKSNGDKLNSIERANHALSYILKGFREKRGPLGPHGTCIKPTRIECHDIRTSSETTVHGDIHVAPADDLVKIMRDVEELVDGFLQENADIEASGNCPVKLCWTSRPRSSSQHESSKRRLSKINDEKCNVCGNVACAKHSDALELAKILQGIEVSRHSPGHKALATALHQVHNGEKGHFRVQGSIPHARLWQNEGYDIQLCGFGKLDQIQKDDESCSLSDMAKGYKVLCRLVCLLEQGIAGEPTPLVDTANTDVVNGTSDTPDVAIATDDDLIRGDEECDAAMLGPEMPIAASLPASAPEGEENANDVPDTQEAIAVEEEANETDARPPAPLPETTDDVSNSSLDIQIMRHCGSEGSPSGLLRTPESAALRGEVSSPRKNIKVSRKRRSTWSGSSREVLSTSSLSAVPLVRRRSHTESSNDFPSQPLLEAKTEPPDLCPSSGSRLGSAEALENSCTYSDVPALTDEILLASDDGETGDVTTDLAQGNSSGDSQNGLLVASQSPIGHGASESSSPVVEPSLLVEAEHDAAEHEADGAVENATAPTHAVGDGLLSSNIEPDEDEDEEGEEGEESQQSWNPWVWVVWTASSLRSVLPLTKPFGR